MKLATVLVLAALGGPGCDAVWGLERGDAGIDVPSTWPNGYRFRKPITITSNLANDFTAVPINVVVTDPELAARARTDGTDLVFTTSDDTVLDSELVTYDAATGALDAWVNVPSVPGQKATRLFLYFGGPQAGSISSNVWSPRFAAVWHLSASGSVEEDSTSHAYRAAGSGTSTPASVAGISGFARMFVGAQSFSLPPGAFTFGTASFAFSMWVRTPQPVSEYDSPFYMGAGTTDAGFNVLLGLNTWNAFVADDVTAPAVTFSGVPITDRWVQLGVVVDRESNLLVAYLDGAQVDVVSLGTFGSTSSVQRLRLSPDEYPLNGILDEVRVYAGVPPPGWFAFEHANLADRVHFLQLGDLQAP